MGLIRHKTVNPILISSHIIIALQSIVTSEIDPLEPVILNFGKISAGDVFDTVPQVAGIEGTVRTQRLELAQYIKGRIETMSSEIAESFKGKAKAEYRFGYPPVVNNKEAAELLKDVATVVVGKENVIDAAVSMVGEDIAYVLQRIKRCLLLAWCSQ